MIAAFAQDEKSYKSDPELEVLSLGGSREVSNETLLEPIIIDLPNSSVCHSVGRFEHPESCEKYNFCYDVLTDKKEFNCESNKAFDPLTQRCVYNYSVCARAPKCFIDNKRILPNPNDKATFFECKHRPSSRSYILRKQNCAEGHEFDADLGYCKSKFSDDDAPSDDNDSSEELECEKPGIFTDHTNDFDYFECVVKSVSKGTLKLIRHSCPKYHIFILREKRCVPFLPMP